MNCSVNLTDATSFILQDALLIYRASRGSSGHEANSVFVTHHDAVRSEAGPWTLASEKGLSIKFLKELSKGLKQRTETEILPPSVLAYGEDTIAWWRPSGPGTLFFSEGTVASHLSGRKVPMPPLVFMVRNLCLSVAALRKNQRPDSSTALYKAPFWNVFDNGGLCHGSMKTPRSTLALTISTWEDAFFGSAFTHPNYHQKAIQHKGGMVGAWEQALSAGAFNPRWLVPLNVSLDSFVKEPQ